MEWINPEYKVREPEEVIRDNGVLKSLSDRGSDSSLYDISLLPLATGRELYVDTKDGKVYSGVVKCLATKQKDKVNASNIVINVYKDICFQFMVLFSDGTWVDARGNYAKTQLKVVSRRNR